ncbi:DUF4280 domain-containing protein [Myroides sp. WP-1]|uniref:DUF4280 domain-containing protein n=1 Tax=Myroides sp. WP-1 TaxID=2759944 RepID=UPI0015FB1A42|nr:DUF4280 domain-containing protein [Myroides sp. WP-1]MBB1138397.1 DUF4280 domain-containing protein [Myroides sp. WP-1]
MSEEHKKYISEGVFLVCDKGDIPSQLLANPRQIKLHGLTQVTEKDNVFGKNILPFGSCKTLQSPCAFGCVTWSKVKQGNYFINGEKPLLEHSEATCPTGGGKIKLYLDQYDAEKSVKKNNETPIIADKISSLLMDVFLTGDLSSVWKLASNEESHKKEGGQEFKKSIEGTANFLLEEMWKTEIWKSMDDTLVIGVSHAIPHSTPGVDQAYFFLGWLDAVCGTEFAKNKLQLEAKLEQSVNKTIDTYQREHNETKGKTSELVSYTVVDGLIGSKGAGVVAEGSTSSEKKKIREGRVGQISTNVTKFARAVRGGGIKVVRVGGKKATFHMPLIEKVLEEAKRIVKTTSAKSRGPCLSGLYDPATGKTFFGLNFKGNPTGKTEYAKWIEDPAERGGADPIIKELVNEYKAKIASGAIVLKEVTDTKYAAHSELRALDQALKARRAKKIPVDRNSIKEMSLSNRDLQPKVIERNNNIPPLKARCQNCEYLTNGILLHGHN